MQPRVAHLFPAFVLKYTGKEQQIIEKYIVDFRERISYAGNLLSLPLDNFDIQKNDQTTSGLNNQLLTYIFSCAFSDILREQKHLPDYISGFSMGLYAAMYHTGAIAYESGLFLIRDVYNAVKQVMGKQKNAMASVIGFHINDLRGFIEKYPSIEIVIKNGIFSYVIAGTVEHIDQVFPKLEAEGAFHLSKFNVSFPYHSQKLKQNIEVFKSVASRFDYRDARFPLVSMVDQRILTRHSDLKKEVIRNVTQSLNFYGTMQTLLNAGIKEFVEVGADKALQKSSKFIEGDFKFHALSRGRYL